MFGKGMSNDQFNSHLETIAKLIESEAHTVEEAAKIVRDAKILINPEEHLKTAFDFAAENLALPEVHVEHVEKKSDD
ncbi:MAG: hypothetical protein IKP64_11110, partial [Selenomonadaceae bacterium]|nr:hypothetical protein [Selenomonadaceae bacterium]MBR4384091.1 hypothetical protein [Selenomonadaceae bacterium]